ncbi:hypothetical protein Syun_024546 [Stephania yunnanensis]|uniref:Uncharacterized protein n=1 Tax=Stephania yunnanensis TaxID=152371 RepID=A0AAP0NJA2_9MAGN
MAHVELTYLSFNTFLHSKTHLAGTQGFISITIAPSMGFTSTPIITTITKATTTTISSPALMFLLPNSNPSLSI